MFSFLQRGKTQIPKMSEIEFTKYYKKDLEKIYPKIKYVIIDSLGISGLINGLKYNHYLDNAYLEYVNDQTNLDKIIKKYIESVNELYETKPSVLSNRIVPVIKKWNYLEFIKKQYKTDNYSNFCVYQKYNEDLIIVYAEDRKNNIYYLNQKDFLNLNIDLDSLSKISITNLVGILPKMKRNEAGDVFMLTAGGDYEASLILYKEIWSKDNFPVNGDIVIAVPNRDILYVTGSENKEGLKAMREMTNNLYNTGDHPLTKELFIFKDNTFIKFDK